MKYALCVAAMTAAMSLAACPGPPARMNTGSGAGLGASAGITAT